MSSMQHALNPRPPASGHGRSKVSKFPDHYFAEDGDSPRCLQREFVYQETDRLAEHLGRKARPALTTGQMRRFFNHCRQLERRLRVDRESWKQVEAAFVVLCAHARSAEGARKIPGDFAKFIDDNVKRVVADSDPGDAFLRGFLPHFEALVGFSAVYMK